MKKAQFVRQLSVSLPKQTISKIKAITDKQEISISQWIREAVEEKFKTMQEGVAK